MSRAINDVFAKIFPERRGETLPDDEKAPLIVHNCQVQKVGERLMLEALCEIYQLTSNGHEWEIDDVTSHITEIVGTEILSDGDVLLVHKSLLMGTPIPEIRERVVADRKNQAA